MSGGTAAVSLAMTAISTAVSMYAQKQQGDQAAKAATAQAQYNAQAAENDKATAMAQAQNELAKGEADAERQRRQAARQQGDMAAGMAGSGFEMSSGSGLSMLGESAQEGAYDNQIIRNNAAQSAWAYQSRAVAAGNEASSALAAGANAAAGAKSSAKWGMGTSLLSGIGQGLGIYNDYQKTQTGKATPYHTMAKPNWVEWS